MLFTDAIALLKQNGHGYLASEAERVVKDLVRNEQKDGKTETEKDLDPLQAMLEAKGYAFPSNAR